MFLVLVVVEVSRESVEAGRGRACCDEEEAAAEAEARVLDEAGEPRLLVVGCVQAIAVKLLDEWRPDLGVLMTSSVVEIEGRRGWTCHGADLDRSLAIRDMKERTPGMCMRPAAASLTDAASRRSLSMPGGRGKARQLLR